MVRVWSAEAARVGSCRQRRQAAAAAAAAEASCSLRQPIRACETLVIAGTLNRQHSQQFWVPTLAAAASRVWREGRVQRDWLKL